MIIIPSLSLIIQAITNFAAFSGPGLPESPIKLIIGHFQRLGSLTGRHVIHN